LITQIKEETKKMADIFKNKKVLVVGLARSGIGAANLLSSLGAKVSATDIKSRNTLKENLMRLLPSVTVKTGGHPEEIFHAADLIVVSPGVSLDIAPLLHARARGIPIIGELELAWQIIQSGVMSAGVKGISTPQFIGITGTNGKSTTTTLIDLMLRQAGFRTLLGGNIGNALTEELYKLNTAGDSLKVDYVVAEISSFQLETIKDFKPFVSMILNITPDHLDRYQSMEEYIHAKARIFKNQGSDDYLILNADDPNIMKLYNASFQNMDLSLKNVRVVFFSREREVDGIYCQAEGLCFNALSTPKTPPAFLHAAATHVARRGSRRKQEGGVFPPLTITMRDRIKIAGVHNLENAMAASLAAILAGCPVEAIRAVLESFAGLEHRLEFVREIQGVTFINDSKGTNIGATWRSLESFQNVVLILGGRDKGSDFTVLRDLIKDKVKMLVLLGEASEKIAREVGGVVETVFVKTIDEAVGVSMSKASAGDVVLLSPACASFDMFKDFQERGKRFKEAVNRLE